MPRVIVSSRFLKPQLRNKRSNLVRYVATRETVEMFTPDKVIPVTERQSELIDNLLQVYPESQNSLSTLPTS